MAETLEPVGTAADQRPVLPLGFNSFCTLSLKLFAI